MGCDVNSEGPEGENWFTFMLVEYTQQKIIIPSKEVGDTVNIEVDVLGKYSAQAWESFAPKMEALEQKVKDLEAKVMVLEGGTSPGKDVRFGKDVPEECSPLENLSSKPERWVRAEQVEAEDLNPKRENRNDAGTRWVRTDQTFYENNY